MPVKSSRFATVMRFENPLTGEAFYYKEFHNRGLKDCLRTWSGLHGANGPLRQVINFCNTGFSTPEPVLSRRCQELFLHPEKFSDYKSGFRRQNI